MRIITNEIVETAKNFLIEKKTKDFFQLFFLVNFSEKYLELNCFTNRETNMDIRIWANSFDEFIKEFIGYVDKFNVDEQVELHMDSYKYRTNFTIRESLEDFEEYQKWLKSIKDIIEKVV